MKINLSVSNYLGSISNWNNTSEDIIYVGDETIIKTSFRIGNSIIEKKSIINIYSILFNLGYKEDKYYQTSFLEGILSLVIYLSIGSNIPKLEKNYIDCEDILELLNDKILVEGDIVRRIHIVDFIII